MFTRAGRLFSRHPFQAPLAFLLPAACYESHTPARRGTTPLLRAATVRNTAYSGTASCHAFRFLIKIKEIFTGKPNKSKVSTKRAYVFCAVYE
jgi:hypothetical protein